MAANNRIIAIVQARMGSARLPGKVLLDIGGEPMLVRVVERTWRAKLADEVVVATTTEPSDDQIASLCAVRGYPCYRGSLHDVLDRYYQAAKQFGAGVVVRITADCPVMDPHIVDETIAVILGRSPLVSSKISLDFAATRLPPPFKRTYPIGLDVEVCTFSTLEHAWLKADQPFHREHVMPFFYEGVELVTQSPCIATGVSPRGFKIALLNHDPDYGNMRWTVDTASDLELIRQIYARFDNRDDFSWKDILSLFAQEPELAQINAEVKHKTAFDVDTRRSLSDQEY